MIRKKPTILNRETLARTRFFHIERLALRFANGTEADYERVPGSPRGSVLIVPMLDSDTVLLIREYAAGTERYELALPKGRIEDGEDMLAAANREIMEETGYAANDLRHLTSLSLAPGYVGHFSHIILARDLYPGTAPGDEPEPIEVVPWRLDELPRLLRRDDCSEARSIAALFIAREYLANG